MVFDLRHGGPRQNIGPCPGAPACDCLLTPDEGLLAGSKLFTAHAKWGPHLVTITGQPLFLRCGEAGRPTQVASFPMWAAHCCLKLNFVISGNKT